MSKFVLEVIACSVADAIEAERGGADRLEVVRELQVGGLTPSIELVKEIKTAVELPLRVMLRESVGFETTSEDEVERLCDAAAKFASIGIDGLVLGFLKHGQVDVELTQRILDSAPSVRATFHHAFEDTADRFEAIRQIKQLTQVDRILSHGGPGALAERAERLSSYQQHASPELTILAGGGIDVAAMNQFARSTTIREFHVGRAARSSFKVEGVVEAPLVHNLLQILNSLS
ncbi:MAG TPA: copper homeostasis protein CutC [Pyrinomonadaceae bacterium]